MLLRRIEWFNTFSHFYQLLNKRENKAFTLPIASVSLSDGSGNSPVPDRLSNRNANNTTSGMMQAGMLAAVGCYPDNLDLLRGCVLGQNQEDDDDVEVNGDFAVVESGVESLALTTVGRGGGAFQDTKTQLPQFAMPVMSRHHHNIVPEVCFTTSQGHVSVKSESLAPQGSHRGLSGLSVMGNNSSSNPDVNSTNPNREHQQISSVARVSYFLGFFVLYT